MAPRNTTRTVTEAEANAGPSGTLPGDLSNVPNVPASTPTTRAPALGFDGGIRLIYTKAPLNKKNYVDWAIKAKNVLAIQGVWPIVSGQEVEPSGPDVNPSAIASWHQRNGIARVILDGSIDENEGRAIRNIENTAEAWQKLRDIHRPGGEQAYYRTMMNIMKLRAAGNTTIQEASQKLEDLWNELEDSQHKDPEERWKRFKICLLINMLPSEYEHVVANMQTIPDLTYNEAVKRLRGEELRRQNSQDGDTSTSTSTAMKAIAKRSSSGSGSGSTKKETRECYYCNKKGHIKKECWSFKKSKEAEKAKESKEAPEPKDTTKDGKMSAAFDPEQLDKLLAATNGKSSPASTWFIDSGASNHVTGERKYFITYTKVHGQQLEVANGQRLTVQGNGTVGIPGTKGLMLTNVWHAPGITSNLVSLGQLGDKGITMTGTNSGTFLIRNGRQITSIERIGRLYTLGAYIGSEHDDKAMMATVGATNSSLRELWHWRLGHISYGRLDSVASTTMGMELGPAIPKPFCEPCVYGKQHRRQHDRTIQRATKHLARVHIDFWGPYRTLGIGGQRYMLTITDDYSRKAWMYPTDAKSKAGDLFQAWQQHAQAESGQRVLAIRCDNAPELKKLYELIRGHGGTMELTAPYTPEQNEVAERINRTIIELTRTMLIDSGLPHKLWPEVVQTAAYLRNRTPTRGSNKTPEELWTGSKPNISHIKVFGCDAYALTPKALRNGLDKVSKKCSLIGYTKTPVHYRLWDPDTQKVITATDVDFNEHEATAAQPHSRTTIMPLYEEEDEWCWPDTITTNVRLPHSGGGLESNAEHQPPSDNDDQVLVDRQLAKEADFGSDSELEAQEPRRSTRVRRPTTKMLDGIYAIIMPDIREPRTYVEAVGDPTYGKQWETAISKELSSLEANGTWRLEDLPPGRKAITSKWVFKVKRHTDGSVDRFKARMVARGFSQQYGIDYTETFAPTVRMASIRFMLATAVLHGLTVHLTDAVSAYLAGDLSEELYMVAPEGYEAKGKATLREFGMEDCKPVATPMEHGQKLVSAQDGDLRCCREDYQCLMGKETWIMTATRPDIAYVVGRLQQFNHDPTETHWIAAKRVLRYLKGTKEAALHYCSRNNESSLIGYSDSDYAEDITRRSTSGRLFMLAGGAIAWASKKQSLVASSTTEAEYIAYSDAAREAAWLRQLCLDIKCKDYLQDNGSILLRGDNQGCLIIAKDPEHHGRTKAIDVRYHHVRDLIARNIITAEYINTEHMLADGLTKALPRGPLIAHKRAYGLY